MSVIEIGKDVAVEPTTPQDPEIISQVITSPK